MRMVGDTLNSDGHEAYCNRFDPVADEILKRDDVKAIFRRAYNVIDQNDAVAAIVTLPHKSIGQLMEIGVALSQSKLVYLFSAYFRQMNHVPAQISNRDLRMNH